MSLNNYLEKLANDLIISNEEKEKIKESITSLQEKVNQFFSEVLEHFCFGSFTRKTNLPRAVDNSSDVDYLIVFRKVEDFDVFTIHQRLTDFTERFYKNEQIIQTNPVGIIDDNGIKIELIPAYKEGKYFVDYKIPVNNVYSEWLPTVPNDLDEQLLKVDAAHNDLILPLIRIIKYWNVLNGHIYSSYFLEKDLINLPYPKGEKLLDYFYYAIENLSTTDLTPNDIEKVNSLKADVKKIQNNQLEEIALFKLSKLFPFI